MHKFFKAAIVTGLFALPAAGQANDLDAIKPEQLLPLAQKEGSVTIFSLSSRIAKVEKAFEEKYPGIDFIGLDMSSTKQIARLEAEQQAGVHAVDVLYIADTPVVLEKLVSKGAVTNYVPPRVADEIASQYQAPLLAHRLSTKVLMYNEKAFPNGSPVTNLWQLTMPEWKGKVLMVDPSLRGELLDLLTEIVLRPSEMAAAYKAQFGKDIAVDADLQGAGEQFVKDLFANDLILVPNSDVLNKSVGDVKAKQPPVGFGTYSDRRDNEKEGWALQVAKDVEPANGILFPAVLAIPAKAPHPAAARLLIDFMFGDDSPSGGPAYKPFDVPGDYATRETISDNPDSVKLEELDAWTINPAKTAMARHRVADLIITLQ
ncbi:iron ABC transporter substrate-binding protein [Rhizobium sp. Root1203]|uniref:extracellular solute-binding protein n=1 Tax=Rhizobium sp. Root1203 TaxID=1736427 RepID=UPI00070FEDDF|nr:extracellular solute-binding protein [Rhizobium sp. Root1203]KQV10786.1 iron ABC transporter substrate-binding protein [Rhizobium sp. Root1203]